MGECAPGVRHLSILARAASPPLTGARADGAPPRARDASGARPVPRASPHGHAARVSATVAEPRGPQVPPTQLAKVLPSTASSVRSPCCSRSRSWEPHARSVEPTSPPPTAAPTTTPAAAASPSPPATTPAATIPPTPEPPPETPAPPPCGEADPTCLSCERRHDARHRRHHTGPLRRRRRVPPEGGLLRAAARSAGAGQHRPSRRRHDPRRAPPARQPRLPLEPRPDRGRPRCRRLHRRLPLIAGLWRRLPVHLRRRRLRHPLRPPAGTAARRRSEPGDPRGPLVRWLPGRRPGPLGHRLRDEGRGVPGDERRRPPGRLRGHRRRLHARPHRPAVPRRTSSAATGPRPPRPGARETSRSSPRRKNRRTPPVRLVAGTNDLVSPPARAEDARADPARRPATTSRSPWRTARPTTPCSTSWRPSTRSWTRTPRLRADPARRSGHATPGSGADGPAIERRQRCSRSPRSGDTATRQAKRPADGVHVSRARPSASVDPAEAPRVDVGAPRGVVPVELEGDRGNPRGAHLRGERHGPAGHGGPRRRRIRDRAAPPSAARAPGRTRTRPAWSRSPRSSRGRPCSAPASA